MDHNRETVTATGIHWLPVPRTDRPWHPRLSAEQLLQDTFYQDMNTYLCAESERCFTSFAQPPTGQPLWKIVPRVAQQAYISSGCFCDAPDTHQGLPFLCPDKIILNSRTNCSFAACPHRHQHADDGPFADCTSPGRQANFFFRRFLEDRTSFTEYLWHKPPVRRTIDRGRDVAADRLEDYYTQARMGGPGPRERDFHVETVVRLAVELTHDRGIYRWPVPTWHPMVHGVLGFVGCRLDDTIKDIVGGMRAAKYLRLREIGDTEFVMRPNGHLRWQA